METATTRLAWPSRSFRCRRHLHKGSGSLPYAAAVTAVYTPAGDLSVAWCGEARAYLMSDGRLRLLTEDHNHRRTAGGSRGALISCLGAHEETPEPRRGSVTRPSS